MKVVQESIFASALRGFVKSIAVVIGIGVAIFILLIGLGALSSSVDTADKSQLKVSPDAGWSQKLLPSSAPVILKMDVKGIIGTKNLRDEKWREMLVNSRTGVLEGNRVKGILLHINSPGGVATDSELIYSLLKQYKEKFQIPIYAYVDGLCASGGMYIACAADRIDASEGSIIGSVGVRLGPNFNVAETMEKVGVKALTITAGKDKDALNPFRPWKENEDASIKAIIETNYEQFVDTVASNRTSLDKEKLVSEYGAQVFVAKKAQELGYVDSSDATYDRTLQELVSAAGIKEGDKYQVLSIEPYQSVFKDLTENKFDLLRGRIEHVFPLAPNLTTDLAGQLLYLYQP